NIDNGFAILLSATRRDLVPQNNLLSVVVHIRTEDELAALSRLLYGPAGEATRDFLDVFLSIAAFNSHRMKFHQFSSIVLVDSCLAPGGLLRRRRSLRLRIRARRNTHRPAEYAPAGRPEDSPRTALGESGTLRRPGIG